mgnify:CR=1 FL=1|jgi:hypothetical protein|tara:strand:- start:11989 stop:12453 length:465 start_codon:yes stop_codon:yes gene_type:complete
MKFQITSYFILRRRLIKEYLKFNGWRFRGQDPPSKWRHILFISPAEGRVLKMQNKWMQYLTSNPSEWVDIGDTTKTKELLVKKHTVLIRWNENAPEELLKEMLESARNHKVRISACAWDTQRKAIKFHSQFKPSFYFERDIRYLNKFFKYFKQI